jgi:DNA-binding LacI/PurR family transcriptional regulator
MDIRTIARMANVSIATVSRTINNVSTVNPKMAKRVWDVIEKLDYVPNTQARALVSGRSKLFGLIVSEITNPFFPELIQGFEDIAVEHGYEILVSSTNHDPKRMSHCIRRMLERKVEGVAIMTFGIEEPLARPARQAQSSIGLHRRRPGPPRRQRPQSRLPPWNSPGRTALWRPSATVISPSSPGPCDCTRRSRAWPHSQSPCRNAASTPEASQIVEGDHTLEGGATAMEKLLVLKQVPTAVICSNDMTAIGVLHKLYRTGMRVPDDISVIGFDDIHIAEVMMPPLTTVQMSRLDIAKAAFGALRSHVESPEQAHGKREFNIPTELIVRESTGFPRGTMTHLRKKS